MDLAILNKMVWIYTKTKERGHGSFELALEEVKERISKCTLTKGKTADLGIPDCFHGCFEAC